jgi:hypothetical protein
MSDFLTETQYKILEALTHWRVVSTKNLLTQSAYLGRRQSFIELLQKLSDRNYVESFRQPGIKEKFFYPTQKTVKTVSPDLTVTVNKDHLYHDAVVTNLTIKLSQSEFIHEANMPHEFFQKKSFQHYLTIDPDSVFFGKKSGENFTLALEAELTQKSKDRILEKFEAYTKSPYYHFALYFFDKVQVFESYKKILNELSNLPRENAHLFKKKIILSYEKSLSSSDQNIFNSTCYYKDSSLKLGEIL